MESDRPKFELALGLPSYMKLEKPLSFTESLFFQVKESECLPLSDGEIIKQNHACIVDTPVLVSSSTFSSGDRVCSWLSALYPSYSESIRIYPRDILQTGAEEMVALLCSCHDPDLLTDMSSALWKG